MKISDLNLNKYNYMNIGGFVLSLLLNIDLGPEWEFGGGVRELPRRGDSISTPGEPIFIICNFIVMFQGIFAVAQCMPQYSTSPMIQEGVRHWFLTSQGMLALWTVIFDYDNLLATILSVAIMFGVLFSLAKVLMSQAEKTELSEMESQTAEEYWLLRFPFSVHFAWTITLLVMNVNALLNEFIEDIIWLELLVGVISIAAYGAIAGKMLFANGENPNYVVPFVIAWVTAGIAYDMNGPQVEDFGAVVSFIARAACFVLSLGCAGSSLYLLKKNGHLTMPAKQAEESEIEATGETAYAGSKMDSDTPVSVV